MANQITPETILKHKKGQHTRREPSPTAHSPHSNLTPSFAILAASIYRIGIAGLAHPPASISLSSGVPFLAAQVALPLARRKGIEYNDKREPFTAMQRGLEAVS